jgi:glycosyltransferase involved in cell wall biosynthesis
MSGETSLRILVLAQQLAAFRSGVGTYADALVRGLRDRGHRVTVVVPASEAVAIEGIEVVPVRGLRWDPTPRSKASLSRAFAKALRERADDVDVAHFADAREAWGVRSPNIPVTGALHDSYALDWLRPDYPRHLHDDRALRSLYFRALRRLERHTYRRFDGLASNSEHVARAVVEGYGLDASRVRVVRLGLPVRPQAEARPPGGDPTVLFTGGNFLRKGLPTLLDACALLLPRHPGLRLHVVGRDRRQERLVRDARKRGLGDAVVFHGWLPNAEVRSMMAGATVFALPSLVEAFGLVYLEAMAEGTPVVATAVGGAREGIVNGEEALFVNPVDARAIAEALDSLFRDPHLRARLAEGGRRAVARFTVDAMVEGTEAMLREVVKG